MNFFQILINRRLNKIPAKNKVFCIGLHKTGTTTLAHFFRKHGFLSSHSTSWINKGWKLNLYDFFSDGGSHFDGVNELNYEMLYEKYPKSKFILQTRDTEKWVVSKLKHAGWDENTIVEADDENMIKHEFWRYKSYLTIRKFIEHKFNYEKKLTSFFEKNDSSRLIKVDITNKNTQEKVLSSLVEFIGLNSSQKISFPHSNKHKNKTKLSDEVITFINKTVAEVYAAN